MPESIMDGLVDYFLQCPLLKEGVFRVNALGDEPVEYALEAGIAPPIIKRYVDGSTVRGYQFNFNSREAYALDRIVALQTDNFYEQFSNWVEDQNGLRDLPEMPEGCEALGLTVLAPGYMLDATMENAFYQIQMLLTYYKKSRRN